MKLRKYLLLDSIILLNTTGRLLAENQKFLSKWKPGGFAKEVCFDILCTSLSSCNLNAYCVLIALGFLFFFFWLFLFS